jgi:hypothetical protein
MKLHFDRSYLASITTSLLLTAVVQGCGGDGGVSANNSGMTGATTPPTATAGSAAAGKSGGTAGSTTTTTTTTTATAGAGATTGAAAGMTGTGTAGAGASAAAGAGSMSSGDLTKCGPASTLPPAMLHQAALEAIVPKDAMNKSPCAFSSCHDSNQKKAMLNLDVGTMDLHATLVDKPSCEVPTLKLIASGGGDAALANSWLYQKLTAATGSSGEIVAQPAWGMGGASCGQDSGQPFGVRMPKSSTDILTSTRLNPLKDWICAGAPGPTM